MTVRDWFEAVGFLGDGHADAPDAYGLATVRTTERLVRGKNWQVADDGDGAWTLTTPGLRWTSQWEIDDSSGVLRRRDRLENVGDTACTVVGAAARFALKLAPVEIYLQQSIWSHENQGQWVPLVAGDIVARCRGGRTSEGGTPYAAVREIGGRGLAFHVLPVGNWQIKVSAVPQFAAEPWVAVDLGPAETDLRWQLAPGEALELPEILVQALPDGDVAAAAPALHRFTRPTDDGQPICYNTWFDRFDALDVAHLEDELAAAKEVGCEVFVVDAGWFGRSGESWSGMTGHWEEKPDAAFYGRMRDFADTVRAAGLGFGLWMEPERFMGDVPIRQEHPEWFLQVAHNARIDLQQPAAAAWLEGEMRRLVETYDLAWMKIDFNASLGVDPGGRELHDYFAVWHGILDRLHTDYPGTVFEGCASGGMRIELESIRHYGMHFISDSADPIDFLRIGQGAWLRLPPGAVERWLTIAPASRVAGMPTALPRTAPVRVPSGATWEGAWLADPHFAVAAALPGPLGLSGDLAGLDPATRAHVAWGVAFAKRWRRLVRQAEGHLLTPVRPIRDRTGWDALQLTDRDADTHLVFVYHFSDQRDDRRFRLRDLDPDRTYTVTRTHPDGDVATTATGRTLSETGLAVRLPTIFPDCPAAAVFVVTPAS